MAANMPPLQVDCPTCGFTTVCDEHGMLDWLRSVGMLRRDPQPDAAMVEELFRRMGHQFRCPECSTVGLEVGEPPEEHEEWGQARICEECGRPLSPERLEVFPDARICAECKERETAASMQQEPDFCPRCGAIMKTRPTGEGVTRYSLYCPECGR